MEASKLPNYSKPEYKESPYSFRCPITGVQVYKGDICGYDKDYDMYISINALNIMEK